jgi:gentisate 1,2-dioxygenase
MPQESFLQTLAAANCQPLWDRYRTLVSREPITPDHSLHWSWRDMQRHIERAIIETRPADAERRVLLLTHPAFNGAAATTTNILGGLQILMPGETAPAHRHTLAAMRFVLQGEGAVTFVDGQPCAMAEGDFIITPSWHWHEHVNNGQQRLVWFDCLDLPLVQHLNTIFFEPGPSNQDQVSKSLKPIKELRFDWVSSVKALEASPTLGDGTKVYHYPQGFLPALECGLVKIPKGCLTPAHRTTSNAVMVVARGAGTTKVGDAIHQWQANDVISLPHWHWASHEVTEDAIVFIVSDKPLLRMLGYLREETR